LNRYAARAHAPNGRAAPDQSVALLPNALRPDLMTPAERLDEIAEILAAGILRVRARLRAPQGSTAEQVRVDFSPDRSMHADRSRRRKSR
jgi:hypothetical protein